MNIAILLGVSEYLNATELNACKNDVSLMAKLVRATNKYSDVLYLDKETSSSNVKMKIIEFLKKYVDSQEEIEELFFYYSGHGLVSNEEFHYVLSDYDPKWINKTTYMNSELDDLIRSIKPKLTVKVVDACYSGFKYIKDTNDLEVKKAIDLSKDKLKNCYFMYSSQNDEVSRATNEISIFTKSFIDSIINTTTESIRYRDIIDYISDSFSQNAESQTPYFVMQSNNTELFGSISAQEKNEIETFLIEIGAVIKDSDKESKIEGVSLTDKIKLEAKNYCKSEEEIIGVFKKIEKHIQIKKLSEQLEELFDFELEFLDEYYNGIEGIEKAAASLKEQAKQYFIKLEYERKMVRVKKRRSALAFLNNEEDEYVEREHDILARYNITEPNIPYTYIQMTLIPKNEYPNLKKYSCYILFAFSKVYIKMLFNHIKYKEVNFGSFSVQEMKWSKSEDLYIKNEDDILKNLDRIIDNFEKYVLDDLYNQFDIDIQDTGIQHQTGHLLSVRNV